MRWPRRWACWPRATSHCAIAVMPLSQVADVHAGLERGELRGKVALSI
jgi:hypothetical protein